MQLSQHEVWLQDMDTQSATLRTASAESAPSSMFHEDSSGTANVVRQPVAASGANAAAFLGAAVSDQSAALSNVANMFVASGSEEHAATAELDLAVVAAPADQKVDVQQLEEELQGKPDIPSHDWVPALGKQLAAHLTPSPQCGSQYPPSSQCWGV